MKIRFSIVIDNTFAPALAKELVLFSADLDWRVLHMRDIARAETEDRHWVPLLKEWDTECEWIVITKDQGRGDLRAAEKLPILCKSHGVACLIVNPAVGRNTAAAAIALQTVWKEIPLLVEAARRLGRYSHYNVKLGETTLKGGAETYKLKVGDQSLQAFLDADGG